MGNEIISNINIYRCASKRNFEKYKVVEDKINELLNMPNSFLLGNDFNEMLTEYINQRNSHFYSCIVFQAMAVEAFLNEYIFVRLGKKYFEALEKLSPQDKLVVCCKMITGKEFPKDNKAFEILINIFKYRNNLVHFKARSVDISTIDDIERLYYTDCNLDEFVSAYNKMVEQINIIDDCFDEQYLTPIPYDFWNIAY